MSRALGAGYFQSAFHARVMRVEALAAAVDALPAARFAAAAAAGDLGNFGALGFLMRPLLRGVGVRDIFGILGLLPPLPDTLGVRAMCFLQKNRG